MNISTQFSKYANHYGSYNVIQEKVKERLLEQLWFKPKRILDLGCGSGAVCKSISWKYEHFIGVDFAAGMLELHPKSKKIECIYGDFNDERLFENLITYEYDYILSASALQWAEDLQNVFKNIKLLNAPISLAIFTSGTFKTLNKTAKLEPLLRDKKEIKELSLKYFAHAKIEVIKYKLEFSSTREMFKYIKKSGVSASRNILSYKQTKKLMNEYPLNYLEFEVIFITSH